MRLRIGLLVAFLTAAHCSAQSNSASSTNAPIKEISGSDLVVMGATADQEVALREQIHIMSPKVLPLRVIFVPHWKYLDSARTFRLHVPTGFSSAMFTHLPSRTVFVDDDRYLGPEWLGHWMAHELGHLESNSAREDDAEKVAHRLRDLLKRARKNS